MPQAADSAESEVRLVMAKMRTASLEGDAATIASLMTDEYLQTDIFGHVQDKTSWFKEYFNPLAELIKAGKFRWETYDRKDLQFVVYGNSVVVTGALELKGSGAKWVPQDHTWAADPNASFSGTLRFTHVYVKWKGKWLLGALHNAIEAPAVPSR